MEAVGRGGEGREGAGVWNGDDDVASGDGDEDDTIE